MFLSFGVSEDKFWDSTPKDLEPYLEAHNLRERRIDTHMWQMGIYVMNAVGAAIDRNLHGRKSRAEYLEKPMLMLSEDKKKEAEMTDAEKFGMWVAAFNKQKKHDEGQEGH